MSTEERIRECVASILGVHSDELSLSTGIGDIPTWDSLAQVAIMTTLEEEFGLEWSADDLMDVTTLGDIIALSVKDAAQQPAEEEPTSPPSSSSHRFEALVNRILFVAEQHPSRSALIFEPSAITYRQLAKGIRAVAAKLHQEGIRKGDRLIIFAERTRAFFYAYFGTHLVGATAVVLDPAVNDGHLAHVASVTQPRLRLGSRPGCNLSYSELESAPASAAGAEAELSEGDTADIMFTTGTTGKPKGVRLTHGNHLASARQINAFIGNNERDVEVLALPICHSFGLGRARCVLSIGGTLVLVPGFTNANRVLEALQEYKANGFSFVPAAWNYLRQMTADRLAAAAPHLKYVEIGSAAMPMEEKLHLMQLLPHTRICMHYGLTEASRSSFIEFHAQKDKLSTAGKPAAGVDIQIFSPTGEPLPAYQEGEVCVRGGHVTPGYLGEAADAMRFNGYFRTGDWGMMDEEGYLHLLSRTKDIINTGGKKVSPDEIENALQQLSCIAECACIPAKDPQGILGEVVMAVCVPSPGADRLTDAAIREQLSSTLEHYKLPSIITWQDTPLPRTESGKLQRNKLL